MSVRSGSLRYFATIRNGTTPASGEASYWDGDIAWATPDDLGRLAGNAISETKRQVTPLAVAENNLNVVPAETVLMSTRAPIGHMAITAVPMAFNQGCRALIPHSDTHGPYLLYLLKSRVPELNASANGTTFVELSQDDLAGVRISLPSLDIQKRIAGFLDEKTARIDALIEKKQALLERLAEKRQAIITQAVTKGLNPAASMKDSGIEWFGRVPEHWEVMPLKRVVFYQEGPGIMAANFRDDGIPLLRVASVGGRWATLEGANFLEREMVKRKWRHFLTNKGDLLISASATSGIVSEVGDEAVGCIPYTGIIRLNPVPGVSVSSFIRHFVVSRPFIAQIDQLKAGSTIQHFGPYHLGLMSMPVPPAEEQGRISLRLDERLMSLENLESHVASTLERLAEFRSTIITAAVTGQIEGLR
jgi:type I restriction enzyme S subunit